MHIADACPAGVGGAGSDCSSLSCQAVARVPVKGVAGYGGFNNAMLHLFGSLVFRVAMQKRP